MKKNERRAAFMRDSFRENFARMFESDFIEQLKLNWFEADHARAIFYNMEYNTPHHGKVIFSETLELSVLTFKTKTAYNEFKKELAARFDI